MADLKLTLKGAAKVDFEIKERRDGSLLVKYISHMSGDVLITLMYGRTNIEGSPFKVRCSPPKAEASNSAVELLQEHAFVEETVKAAVRTYDQFGERCGATGELQAVVLDAATGSPLFEAHVVETGLGDYEVSFVPEMAGMYALNVLVGGHPAQGCPLKVKVLADETLAKNCRCFGAGMAQCMAGEPTSFTIQAVDGRGVARKQGGDDFDVVIKGPEGDAPHATIRDNAEGTYVVSWTGKYTGLYSIGIQLDGSSVGGTPFNCNVLPTTISPEACTAQAATIARVRAGERADFRIIARDKYGNVRSSGGDVFTVVLRMVEGPGQTEVRAAVNDESKGFYKANFTVQYTGVYQVHVMAEGHPIKGSPFRCEATSGRPDFTKCKLGGPGLEAVRLGQPCDVLIELYDVFSNKITSALDALSDISVSVDGPSRVSVNPAGMKAGAACFQYVAMHPGVYTVTATIEGRHINNSPATVTASIAKPHAPLCEVLTNTKDLLVSAGKDLRIIFVAKDKAGIRKSVGGDIFAVSWRSLTDKNLAPCAARVTDLGTGEYYTMFTETTAGAYGVSIMHEDRHIAGSPLTVTVQPAALEPSKTTASGQGLVQSVATQAATIQVLARDLFGNTVKNALKIGPGEIEAVLRGPETVELTPVKVEAGCVTLSYVCTKTGTYDLSVTHMGHHIAASPWKVAVMPGPAIAAMCSLRGLPSSIVAGVPFAFSLHTVDECNNPTISTNTVTAEVDSPSDGVVPLVVSEDGHGVYKISGMLKGAVASMLRLLVNGSQLPNVPVLSVVPSSPTSIAWSSTTLSSHGIAVQAGEEAHAELVCLDAYGNRIGSATQGVAAQIRHDGLAPDQPGQACRTAPMPDGTVRVFFRPERATAYQLYAVLAPDGQPTKMAPIMASISCQPGPMDMGKSSILRADATMTAGKPGCLVIKCIDVFGNPTSNVPAVPVTVTPSGPGKMHVWWERPPRTSQLSVFYTSTVAGAYSLSIMSPAGNATVLAGTPLQVVVEPDNPCSARCAAVAYCQGRRLTPGSATMTAGQALEVQLALADVYGNPVSRCDPSSQLEVSARSVGGASFALQAAAGAAEPGKPVSFAATAERAGLYSVQVRILGTPLPGWALPLLVQPAKAHAAACRLRMPAHVAAKMPVGEPVSVVLSTADAFGNTRHDSGPNVSPMVMNPDQVESSRAAVKDLSDGQYLISFTPDEPGEWVVSAIVDGDDISPGHEVQVMAEIPPLTVDMCSIYLPDDVRTVPAGASFCVAVVGPENCDSLPADGSECVVHLTAPDNRVTAFPAAWESESMAFVTELFMGTVGSHAISATLNGERVGGAEGGKPVLVVPNSVELNASDISGAGLKLCHAGEQAEVVMQARDALGNAGASITGAGGGPLGVQIVVEACDGSVSTVTMKPDPTRAGNLKATYIVKRAGPVKLAVQLTEAVVAAADGDAEADGEGAAAADAEGGVVVIQQRSFAAVCKPGKPSPLHFELQWAREPLVAGVEAHLRVVCKDAYQNLLQLLPGNELWTAFLQQGNSQVGSVEIQPMTDSRYGFSIRCDSAGPTSLLISFGGTALFGGAIPLVVTAAEVSVLTSSAEFVAMTSSVVAGRSFSVRGVLRDALYNEVPADEKHSLKVALAPGRTDAIMFNHQSAGWRQFAGDGTTAHCTVETAGTYIVHASVGDVSLPGWPRVISVVAGDADAKRCTVHRARPAAKLVCGERSKLTLVTRDAFGNRCAVGGARVEVAARALGSVQPGQVIDRGDGTYSLGLVLDVEGDWDITASVHGVPVAGMPLRVKACYPLLSAADCELLTLDAAAPIAVGAPSRLAIQAKGVEKTRRVFTGAESIAVVTIDDAGHEVRVPVVLENKGLLATAALLPLLPGALKVAVLVNGEQLAGSPMTLEVVASPLSPTHCSVIPVTPDTAASYKLQLPPSSLLIVTGTDALGNATRIPQDDIALTFIPPANVSEVSLQTLVDGTVAVCGVVRSEAEAHVSVQGTKLTQVPVVLRPAMRITADGVTRGSSDASRSLMRTTTSGSSDASRLRVLQAPDAAPIAGNEFKMVVRICDMSGGMLHYEGASVVASLSMKADIAATPRTTEPADSSMHGLNGRASSASGVSDERESLTLGLPGAPPPHSAVVTVTPLGSGMFALEATPQLAGMYTLKASVDTISNEASMLAVPVEVRPGKLAAEKCALLLEARSCNAWTAGKTAKMVARLFDRFLNPVSDVDTSQLDIKVAGPGNVVHTTAYGSTGKSSVEIRLSGRVAGRYEISVRDRESGKLLGGPPIMLVMHASSLNPRLSSFHLRGLQVKGSQAAVQAGQGVELALSIFDAFGNVGEVSAANTEVHASGPGGVLTFRPSSAPPPAAAAANGDAAAHSPNSPTARDVIVPILLTRAGPYRLTVEVRGHDGQVLKLPGAPGHDVLVIKPATASPAHTIVESWPAPDKPMPTGAPHNLIIVPCDAFGNPGAPGAAFTVQLTYPATAKGEGERCIMSITPSGNSRGDLIATVLPKAIGSPALQVLCAPGGATNGAAAVVVAAQDVRVVEAPTTASMCFLSGVWPESGAVVGTPAGMLITAADAYGNLRHSGGDRFTVEVPGLARQAITMTDRGDGSYTIEFVPAHEGTLAVHVLLDGVHVRGSPMSLSVHRDIDQLARSALTGKLSTAVTGLRRGLDQARRMQASLRADAEQLQQYVPVLVQSAASDLSNLMREQMRLLQDARLAVNREGAERRRLHNLVQELRGNIRVYVRVKPLTPDEAASGLRSVLHCPTDTRIECNTGTSTKAFDFDRVFNASTAQSEVFAEVAALVTSALDGYNVCVFAYGQTGSGKTHTMEGPVEDPGISFRTIHELFRVINNERHTDHSHVISASIVEIYNEQVRDLLAQGSAAEDLELQKTATGFVIPGLTKVPVSTAEQITQVMATGYESRVVACHDINAHSSRSHALLIVEVAATNLASGIRTIGKLTLCDLAGSERVNKTGASGLNLVEAQNINKSLLELGNVMSSLMSNSSHVPYRNSKLTMLLQDSLGGDSKALMFCNLAPHPAHVSETLSSLAFASKVSSVVLRTPGRRVEEAPAAADDDSFTPGLVTPQRGMAPPQASVRKSLAPK